jgi:hypothetical protein
VEPAVGLTAHQQGVVVVMVPMDVVEVEAAVVLHSDQEVVVVTD